MQSQCPELYRQIVGVQLLSPGTVTQSFIVKCALSVCTGVHATCTAEDSLVESVSAIYLDSGFGD